MTSKELVSPIVKIIEFGTITAGGTVEKSWTADDDYVIRHILIYADGQAPTKSTVTMRIDNYVITKDKALCRTFGTNAEDALLLNIPFGRSSTFYASIKNNEGADKEFIVELVLEKAT
jgi:hypothetical protein